MVYLNTLFHRYLYCITVFTVLLQIACVWLSTDGGGTDPNNNRQLARVLEDGKSKDVPNTTMLEALRRMVNGNQK